MSDSKLVEFYKNHIDWRYFNYLLDRLIEFQDMGCTCMIGICYDAGRKGKPMIYIKSDDYEQYICGSEDMETTDFIYKINITTHSFKYNDKQAKHDFIESIKNKSIIINDLNDTHIIYTKPK